MIAHALALILLAQPGEKPADAAAPPLGGPKVAEAALKNTIVEKDFYGKVRRVETTPEEAAVGKLTLDDDAKLRIEKCLRERAMIVDKFVAENIDLLTKFGTAGATNNKLDQLALATEAYRKLEPLRERGPLEKEIRAALGEQQTAEFNRLVKEYWDAVFTEARQADPKKGRWEVLLKEKLEGLGREIERSFKRQSRTGEILYRYLTYGVTLREEQQTKVREVCARYAEKYGLEVPPAEGVKMFFEVQRELDKEQQKLIGKRVRGMK